MTRPWWWAPRTLNDARGVVLLLACQAWLAGCGRSSKSHQPGPAGGSTAEAGQGASEAGGGGVSPGGGRDATAGRGGPQGGDDATGGAAGGAGSTAGAVTGASGASGNLGGQSGSGGAGAATTAGGLGGAGSGTAGDPGGGSAGDNDCRDLCAPGAPACCTTELACVSHVPSCRIDVLVGRVGVVSEYAALQEKIAALSGEVAFTLADADIEWAAAEAAPASRLEFHLTRDASNANRDALTSPEVDTQPFRFVCDEEPLFVGVFYLIYGAAGLQTPVLHVDDVENDALVLKLGAWQGAWLLHTSNDTGELRARIDRAELRTTFCARSALDVLEPF